MEGHLTCTPTIASTTMLMQQHASRVDWPVRQPLHDAALLSSPLGCSLTAATMSAPASGDANSLACPSSDASAAEPVAVDAIEGSKENIQPTRRGHNPHALLRTLQPSPSPSSSSSLSTERAALECAILSYSGSDPLLPYLRYIQWTLTSYPSLSQSSHLLPVLEKTTRTFLDHPAYLNDPRYTRVWLLYAERCPQPGDVYQFMHSRGIGAKVAIRFVEWSAWHERLGRLREAEDALQLGIDCLAQPPNSLRFALKGLHARNARRLQQQLALQTADALDPLSDVALAAMNDHPTRRALSSLTSSSSSPSPSTPTPILNLQPYRNPTPAPISSYTIPIYTDTSTPSPFPLPPSTGGWRQLPSQGVVDKENVVGVSTWTTPLGGGGKVGDEEDGGGEGGRGRGSGRGEGVVEVWKDEECERREREEEEARERDQARVVREGEERRRKAEGMRRRMDAAAAQKSSHSKLTLDPLRHMHSSQQQRRAPAPPLPAASGPAPATRPATLPAARPATAALGMASGLVVSLSGGGEGRVAAGAAVPSAVRAGARPPPSRANGAKRTGGNGLAIFNDFA